MFQGLKSTVKVFIDTVTTLIPDVYQSVNMIKWQGQPSYGLFVPVSEDTNPA